MLFGGDSATIGSYYYPEKRRSEKEKTGMKLEAITSNIYRLRGSGKQPPSLLERYELLRVPRESRELKEGTEYV